MNGLGGGTFSKIFVLSSAKKPLLSRARPGVVDVGGISDEILVLLGYSVESCSTLKELSASFISAKDAEQSPLY